ncbi:hypothetical protein A2U01_0111678, partial [Trifolium medium]|nr:hypothetical protein [Trifolium medium]
SPALSGERRGCSELVVLFVSVVSGMGFTVVLVAAGGGWRVVF